MLDVINENSAKTYVFYLDKFKSFVKLKDYDSFLKIKPKELENLIIIYIRHLKKLVEIGDISPNGIPTRINPIQTFCVQNDIILNWKKLRNTFPRREKRTGEVPYFREEIQSMITVSKTFRERALVLFFTSTGTRPEASLEIRMKHVREWQDGCLVITIYPEDQEEYPVFLTPEATKYLKEYLKDREYHGEKLNLESPLFRNAFRQTMAWHNVRPMTTKMLINTMTFVIKRAKIRAFLKKRGPRYEKQLFGGFRKWFETTLNNIDSINANVVEKLMGHANDLRGVYYNPAIEKRFSEFRKAIPDLTVLEDHKKDVELSKMRSEQRDKQFMQIQIDEHQRQIDWLIKNWGKSDRPASDSTITRQKTKSP